MTTTDDEIIEFFKFILKHLSNAAELLVDNKGNIRHSNFIISGHYILNEMTNEIREMDQQLRHDTARKSRSDYLKLMAYEKELTENVRNAEKPRESLQKGLSSSSNPLDSV